MSNNGGDYNYFFNNFTVPINVNLPAEFIDISEAGFLEDLENMLELKHDITFQGIIKFSGRTSRDLRKFFLRKLQNALKNSSQGSKYFFNVNFNSGSYSLDKRSEYLKVKEPKNSLESFLHTQFLEKIKPLKLSNKQVDDFELFWGFEEAKLNNSSSYYSILSELESSRVKNVYRSKLIKT